MAGSGKVFRFCSVLMAALFAYSASVQLNDPDWYFWFPLYSGGCAVNVLNNVTSSKRAIRRIAKVTLFLGLFLFMKVIVGGIAGFWSLDLSERVVREKTGSLLVVFSMILHLGASIHRSRTPTTTQKKEFPPWIQYGMGMLVAFSFGLPFAFFVFGKGEMKFD